MMFDIKEVDYNNKDFKELCCKLDDFQNTIIQERIDKWFGKIRKSITDL